MLSLADFFCCILTANRCKHIFLAHTELRLQAVWVNWLEKSGVLGKSRFRFVAFRNFANFVYRLMGYNANQANVEKLLAALKEAIESTKQK